MNHDEKLVTDYKVWKNEEERINASIISEVRRESIKEGIEQKEKEMILNMYNDNLSLDLISKYANLSIEQVQKIISNNK